MELECGQNPGLDAVNNVGRYDPGYVFVQPFVCWDFFLSAMKASPSSSHCFHEGGSLSCYTKGAYLATVQPFAHLSLGR